MPKAFAFLALDARREAPGYAEARAERARVGCLRQRIPASSNPTRIALAIARSQACADCVNLSATRSTLPTRGRDSECAARHRFNLKRTSSSPMGALTE